MIDKNYCMHVSFNTMLMLQTRFAVVVASGSWWGVRLCCRSTRCSQSLSSLLITLHQKHFAQLVKLTLLALLIIPPPTPLLQTRRWAVQSPHTTTCRHQLNNGTRKKEAANLGAAATWLVKTSHLKMVPFEQRFLGEFEKKHEDIHYPQHGCCCR